MVASLAYLIITYFIIFSIIISHGIQKTSCFLVSHRFQWCRGFAPKSPPSVISISAAIPRYASKAPRARIRHPNPMPQMFMTCATLQYWGVGRGQLGWIKLDQIQDFWKVSCEVNLSIFHKAVAWGTLLLSTADFLGRG